MPKITKDQYKYVYIEKYKSIVSSLHTRKIKVVTGKEEKFYKQN